MASKSSSASRGAWNLLRLALHWVRKGGALKLQLRLVPKFLLKTVGQAAPRSQIWYGERELSFEKTPVVHVKMHHPGLMRLHLPRIPCVNPHVDFDSDFDDEDDRLCYGYDVARKSFLENGDEEETRFNDEEVVDGRVEMEEGQGIDPRAEEFIAKFYEQMKLQRQISHLQYNEMLQRRAS